MESKEVEREEKSGSTKDGMIKENVKHNLGISHHCLEIQGLTFVLIYFIKFLTLIPQWKRYSILYISMKWKVFYQPVTTDTQPRVKFTTVELPIRKRSGKYFKGIRVSVLILYFICITDEREICNLRVYSIFYKILYFFWWLLQQPKNSQVHDSENFIWCNYNLRFQDVNCMI